MANIEKEGNVTKYGLTEGRQVEEDFSIYARQFDSTCFNWDKDDIQYNIMFLRMQESFANELLRHRRHLFLNEVYDLIGIPRSKEGQVVGWIYDPENNTDGDNCVIFDMHVIKLAKEAIIIDFNVDGLIIG